MNAQDITAIVDHAELEQAGAIVYFNFNGPTDRDALLEAWEAEGLDTDLIPEFTGFRKAMTRAVEDVCRGNGFIKLKRPSGWEVVDKNRGADVGESAGTVECTVALNAVSTLDVTPDDYEHAELLSKRYFHHLYTVTSDDTSKWVIKLLRRVKALSLRGHGGVYFIARGQLDLWRRMVACIKQAGEHRLNEIPALKGDEATEAIMDALIHEADRAIAKVEEAVDAEETKAGQLKTHGARLARLAEKMSAFDGVVGDKLTDLRAKLDAVEAATTEAILIAVFNEEQEG